MTSDSIIARPMIIGVTIFPEAPGLRAIPSRAEVRPRDWLRAPPKAAMEMPKPAPRAMATFTLGGNPAAAPSAVASSAAKAKPAAPKTRAHTAIKNMIFLYTFIPPYSYIERRICILSYIERRSYIILRALHALHVHAPLWRRRSR